MAFLVHRWLGIALALLMAVWAVSGVVMMYVSFPETTAEERVAGLAPLDLTDCCRAVALPAGPVDDATVEMLDGQPVVRWSSPDGTQVIGLRSSDQPQIGEAAAASIARTYIRQAFGTAPDLKLATIDRDQWTVYGRFREHDPLYKATFADDRGTVVYVSGQTGEVVQDTNARERFWNWLGAVPHWLYFTVLREHTPLWYNLVVYASVLGVFLTVTGIYVGLRMYGRGKRRSPFRGIALWHHWTGLIFGLVTLTWVFSGLVSMNPWGWMESDGPSNELAALAGRPANKSDVRSLYDALSAHPQRTIVSAELSIQGGKAYAIFSTSGGLRSRAALPSLSPAPLSPADLAAKARVAKPGVPIRSLELITEPDAYHYNHHTKVILPAFRVIYDNDDATRLYFDPFTGELINYIDAPSRAYRWLHYGLHRLDFGGLRARPLWDLVVLPLVLGISVLCFLGAWMGVRRLRRHRASRLPPPRPQITFRNVAGELR